MTRSKQNKTIQLKFSLDVLLVSFALIIPMVGYLNFLLRGFTTSWSLILINIIYLGIINKGVPLKTNSLRKDFSFLVLFVVVVFLNFLLVDLNSKSQQYFLIFFFFIILYILDALFEYDIRKKMTIVYIILVVLGVQAAISIPYIFNADFMLIRNLSAGELSEDQTRNAIMNGVGTNALYTSLSSLSLFGLVFQKYISNVFARFILILSLFCMIFTVFISTFFASILMFLLGLVLLALLRYKSLLKIRTLLILLFAAVISKYVFEHYLSDTRLLDPIIKKVESFMFAREDVTGRDRLAKVSLETFYDNPFFGIGVPNWRSYDKIGEHMPWVDFLANFGILGILPFIFFLLIRVKNRFADIRLNNEIDLICLIGVVVFILSNFISPMITSPITYIGFIFVYTSRSFKKSNFAP